MLRNEDEIALLHRVAEIEGKPEPLKCVGNFSKPSWIFDYDPMYDADSLIDLIKKYCIAIRFEGAGVVAKAQIRKSHKMIFSGEVFNASFEKAVIMSVVDLMNKVQKVTEQ